MSLLKQAKPTFETVHDINRYIAQKEESLQFWQMLRSVDTSEKVKQLNNEISEAKQILAEWMK
ncbi:MAG TPA: hypothetical protein VD757_01790 [Candidatus Nitrosocosmicus sp.]|nr:hypothetical protein [Candidatus Nitrosocosmicus sp.]